MDIRRSPAHRLLQVYVSGNGVFEVYVNMKTKRYHCTCPGFRARRWCKHCEAVAQKYLAAGGGFSVSVCDGATPLDDEIMLDAVKFRDWIIHYAKVETL